MKILIDEMPMFDVECLFCKQGGIFEEGICSFTQKPCTLPDGECKWLSVGKEK